MSDVLDAYYAYRTNQEAKDEGANPEAIAKREGELARYRRGVQLLKILVMEEISITNNATDNQRLHMGKRQATSVTRHGGEIVPAGYVGAAQVYREVWLELVDA